MKRFNITVNFIKDLKTGVNDIVVSINYQGKWLKESYPYSAGHPTKEAVSLAVSDAIRRLLPTNPIEEGE
jgi:hypothetical protein